MAARSLPTKRKSPWHCDLCDVTVTSDAQMAAHVRGKKHRSKEDLSANEERTHCVLCNVKWTSSAMAEAHYSGKKHRAKAMEVGAEKSDLWCGLCNLKCDSQATMRSHCEGRRHRNKLKEKNADYPFDEMSKREEKGLDASKSESVDDASGGKGKGAEESGVENVNGSDTVEEKNGMETLVSESLFEVEGNGNEDVPSEEMGKQAEDNGSGGNWLEVEGNGNGVVAVSTLRHDGHILDTAPTFQSDANTVLVLHPCVTGGDPDGKMHKEAEGNGIGSESPGKHKEFLCIFCKVKYHSMNELMDHRSEEHKARL